MSSSSLDVKASSYSILFTHIVFKILQQPLVLKLGCM
jgi:hypothetical protein